MTLRKVLHAESCGPGRRWNLGLECGHTLEWVYVERRMPQRKHCHWCEGISAFALRRPGDYASLMALAGKIPPEDRACALLGWITHCMRADLFQLKVPELDYGIALRITEEPALYPLPLDDDDSENSLWQSC